MATQEESVKNLKTLELYQLSHAVVAIPSLQRKLIKRFGKHVNQYGVNLPESIENSYVTTPKWKNKASDLSLSSSSADGNVEKEKKIVVFKLPIDEIGLDTCHNCQVLLIPGYNLSVRIKDIEGIEYLSYGCFNCGIDMRFQGIVKKSIIAINNNGGTSSGDFLKKMHEINSATSSSDIKQQQNNKKDQMSGNNSKNTNNNNNSKNGVGKKKRQKSSLSKLLIAKKESESKSNGFDLFDMMKQI